jgi:hypothetical protein
MYDRDLPLMQKANARTGTDAQREVLVMGVGRLVGWRRYCEAEG